MATWKEKGEVPDSDDDDTEDGQNLMNDGEGASGLHNAQGDLRREHGTQWETEYDQKETFHQQSVGSASSTSHLPELRESFEGNFDNRSRISKRPAILSELGEESAENLQGRTHSEDKISESYASLSPQSSLLSSCPPSPVNDQHLQSGDSKSHCQSGARGDIHIRIQPDTDPWEDHNEGGHGDTPTGPARRRRTLRERNPIQIHPFLIEEERYRQTLKARNLKPLRLAQVQQDARQTGQKEDSPDLDFETRDDNQNTIFETKTTPSQLSSQLTVSGRSNDTLLSSQNPDFCFIDEDDNDNDDEFPDIDELLKRTHDAFENPVTVSRKLPHSPQAASRLSSKPRASLQTQAQKHYSISTDIFDVPLSPPTTSSPLPGLIQSNLRRGSQSALPTSATSTAPSPEHASSLKDNGIGGLPTPSTNTAKHTVDLTLVETDEDRPLTFGPDSTLSSSSSESDKSSQIRRVGKKIRGVLPASWLRLDQYAGHSIKYKTTNRRSRSLSPDGVLPRRGIAIPKDAEITMSSRDGNRSDPYFLADDSEGDDPLEPLGFAVEPYDLLKVGSVHRNENTQSVIEEDRIDAMLPSRKRQASLYFGEGRRKVQRILSSTSRGSQNSLSRQPKITEHLIEPRPFNAKSCNPKGRKIHRKRPILQTKLRSSSRNSSIGSPPRLSILDVIKHADESRDDSPQFIRIAARNARSRVTLGRHSPTRKFIRLANREDTLDAESTLRDWREGTIRPNADLRPLTESSPAPRLPTNMSLHNKEVQQKSRQQDSDVGLFRRNFSTGVHRLLICKSKQTQINWQTQQQPAIAGKAVEEWLPGRLNQRNPISHRKPYRSSRVTVSLRPAQLETSGTEYNDRHPNIAFRSTKRTLDALYKKSRRDPIPQRDIRMARFLADDELEAPAVVADTPIKENNLGRHNKYLEKITSSKAIRCRKRTPIRIDARAAKYQQPSDPLILGYLTSTTKAQEKTGSDGKLIGLGSVDTQYTSHFNIFPLELGVYFHQSTFLGSGLFSEIFELPTIHIAPGSVNTHPNPHRIHKLYEFAEKKLRWGPWDETISSELGICFDWIIEQLDTAAAGNCPTDVNGVTKCLTFIVEYIQQALEFPSEECYQRCLFRFIEVLEVFTGRLRELTLDIRLDTSQCIKLFVDISALGIVLIFQLLRISRIGVVVVDTTRRFEVLLERLATIAVQILLLVGLECIRDLYDDLQYLAFRESGIKADRYAAQAWVIVMHILRVAQIPGVSFWGVVNSQLIPEYATSLSDARVFERLWYSMFSLLPLVEFDKLGVLNPGLGHSLPFENWSLPQQIAKRIFELYTRRSRQSPSFNDYCRALFSRCFHLIEVWGWRRHSSIIGTLFDFFASHKLSHLRNEDAYRSPRFLEELNRGPSLAIEPEDRCFHILLKIIATSIKQLRSAEDSRGIRNLVARVLPNHDRQYPKEEAVTQRDLASLRNNHDLLCTLFWAAPPNLRPPISLIRELVNPEYSHREAYLINLQAWENLARFTLSSSPEPSAFEPLNEWQFESFELIVKQYLSVDKDIEEQLAKLPIGAKRLISQDTINKTLQKNKEHIRMVLDAQMQVLLRLMSNSFTMDAVKQVLDTRQLTMYLSLISCELDYDNHSKTDGALILLYTYLDELHKRVPISPSPLTSVSIEEDSQNYGSESGFIELANPRSKYIEILIPRIFDAVRRVVQRTLHAHSSCIPVQLEVSKEAMRVWAFLAATLITGGFHDLSDYFATNGKYAEVTLDSQSISVRNLASRFLLQVLEFGGGQLSLKDLGRDPLTDFLSYLVLPGNDMKELDDLIIHYAACEPVLVLWAHKYPSPPFPESRDSDRRLRWDHFDDEDSARRLLALTEEIFTNMRKVLIDDEIAKIFYPTQTLVEIRRRYEDVVSRISDQMASTIRYMNGRAPENAKFEVTIKEIRDQMVIHFPNIQLPHISPDLFNFDEEGVKSLVSNLQYYGLQLQSDRGKSTLFFYCIGAIKKAAIDDDRDTMKEMLLKATNPIRGKWADLSEQLFCVLTQALLHNAFTSEIGWFLAGPFVEAAGQEILRTTDKRHIFAVAAGILRTIINGLFILGCSHRGQKATPWRLKRGHIETLILATRFLNGNMELLLSLADTYGSEDAKFWLSIYAGFAVDAIKYLRSPFRVHIEFLAYIDNFHESISDPHLENLITNYESIFLSDMETSQREVATDAAADAIINYISWDTSARTREGSRRLFLDLVAGPKYQMGQYMFWRLQETWTDDRIKQAGFSCPPILHRPMWAEQVLDELLRNWKQSRNEDGETISVREGQQYHVVWSLPNVEIMVIEAHEKLQRELETFVFFHRKFTMPRANNARTRALGYERPNYDLVL